MEPLVWNSSCQGTQTFRPKIPSSFKSFSGTVFTASVGSPSICNRSSSMCQCPKTVRNRVVSVPMICIHVLSQMQYNLPDVNYFPLWYSHRKRGRPSDSSERTPNKGKKASSEKSSKNLSSPPSTKTPLKESKRSQNKKDSSRLKTPQRRSPFVKADKLSSPSKSSAR